MKRFVLFLSVLALVLPLFSFAGCAGGEVPRSKYDISAEYEGGVLTAEMSFTYHNAEECEMPALEFNLYGNAYREGAALPPRKFPPARRGRCAGRTKISCASSLKSLCRPAGKRRSRSDIL